MLTKTGVCKIAIFIFGIGQVNMSSASSSMEIRLLALKIEKDKRAGKALPCSVKSINITCCKLRYFLIKKKILQI